MTLPGNLATGVVTGTFTKMNGTAATGSVSFDPEPPRLLDAAADVIVIGDILTASLDGNGSFTITLPATDDPDVSPTGWTYTVTATITGVDPFVFSMAVPSATTTNIADVAPSSGTGGVAGAGLPSGGVAGQVLAKNSASNFDAAWTTGLGKIASAAAGVAATDTAAVQAFLDASAAGDVLFFPAGTYLINATISFPSERRYVGVQAKTVSGRTVFKMAPGANLDAIWASATYLAANATPVSAGPVVFEYLCFDGDRTNQTSGLGYGLCGFNYQSSVTECKFANTFGHGLVWTSVNAGGNQITNTCNELMVSRCQFLNTGGDNFRTIEGSSSKITDGMIVNCIAGGGLANGINIDKGAGWLIDSNHTYVTPLNGIKVSQAFQTTITNNYCEGWGTSSTVSTYCGINVATGFVATAQASVIANNKVAMYSTLQAGVTIRAIGVTAATSAIGRVAITGNVVYGKTHTTATTGLLMNCNDSGGTMVCSVAGNQIVGCDTNYLVGSTGAVQVAAGGNVGGTPVAETFSASIAISPGKAACNGHWRMTLTANLTAPTIQAGVDGQTIRLVLKQDATGSRVITWPANVLGGVVLSTAANAVDIIELNYSAIDTAWFARLL